MTYHDPIPADSPFNLENDDAYRRWRDAKLADYPAAVEALVVEVRDPRRFSDAELAALRRRVEKTNLVIYAGATGDDPDKAIARRAGEQLGLVAMDANYLSDDDGLTSLTVNPGGERAKYIPYTDRPISWHTDGYYNLPERQIRGLLLHCVHAAASGGENALLDQEIAYILLRDADPGHIRALMQGDAMTIPPGKDSEGGERGDAVGPVFAYHAASDSLHMRYTARKRNIVWSAAPAVQAAVAALGELLASDLPYIYRARLEPGMGLLCNNVLHDRTGFNDPENASRRLVYRARYFDRIRGTGVRELYP
ncbi:TauD/TfdA family dioxygenase [Endothiovibrio diazotrophicus]